MKHFAFLYSLNWQLVADAFGTWRKSISNDKRTDWDCMVRWDRMFGPMSKQLALQQQQQQQQQMELDDNTPIGSRKASRNAASRYKEPPPTPSSAGGSVQMMPPPGQQQQNTGPIKLSDLNRKQIRRGFMHEAMKRTAKKRELAIQKGSLSEGNWLKITSDNLASTSVQLRITRLKAVISSISTKRTWLNLALALRN